MIPHVGTSYICEIEHSDRWQCSFYAEVEKVYRHSALVKIIATHELDDHLLTELNHRTIVPLTGITEVQHD